MVESLVIRLSDDMDNPVTWVMVNSLGQMVNTPMAGTLEDAAFFAGTRKVTVLVPSTDVLITNAEIPPARGSKLLQALPYALEEQLAQDVEDMHFSIGPKNPDGSYLAAAVSRTSMDTWSAGLERAGIYPKVMIPESTAMPTSPGQVTNILVEGNLIFCQQPSAAPITFADLGLQDVLDLLGIGQDQEAPDDVTVYVQQDEQAQLAASLESLRRQVSSLDVQLLSNGTLPQLAVRAVQKDALNLLQGDFAAKTSLGKHWQPWKLVAGLAAAFFVVSSLGKIGQGIALAKEEARLSESIKTTFQIAFPGQRMQADVRRQAESALGQSQANTDGSSFLQALETLSSSMKGANKAQLIDISFRGGVMNLKVNAPDTVSLEGIKDRISETGGFSVTIAGAKPKDDGVEGRLEIRRVGS